ncbi:2b4677d6-840d-40e3-9667-e72b2f22075c [Thermothielavioides terrestris]|uniref:2b4677d6-840d-40e3-9667-e72b2f22075c n=1 Tax=Thermothielavioides terrestris TaxID=2587410 RepID=A0A3S4AKL6_9PEZI|nr:2b4677d6-840d-40e3-9667-e72b2f22075c [Thermothielavioides terrestris]
MDQSFLHYPCNATHCRRSFSQSSQSSPPSRSPLKQINPMADKPCAHFSKHGCTTMVAKDGDLCANCQKNNC